ncbi:MAG: tannase/feruloyl esterase family alpha/beta hydrolase [Sphingomicrobium sp.]
MDMSIRGMTRGRHGGKVVTAMLLVGIAAAPGSIPARLPDRNDFAGRCAAMKGRQSDLLGTIIHAATGPATFEVRNPFSSQALALPPHCEINATFPARSGMHSQTYAIKYHMRLPEQWNGRFMFQGGGGTNGEIGDALGSTGVGNLPALLQGYAVVSQDSGHDNAVNNDPSWGGTAVFGTDPEARRDYGHASFPKVARAAKSLIRDFYGVAPKFSYFYGCSKGGQEGMAFAQRYPDLFDGIVAAAPGFSLPRAAVAQAADTQTFARLWDRERGKLTPASFAGLFTDTDFAIVHESVAKACDGLDGLRDGIIADFGRCTSQRVLPSLRLHSCRRVSSVAHCIAPAKIDALEGSLRGPRDRQGNAIYADWPWDLGIGSPDWSFWKLGNAHMPPFNVLIGGMSLPSVFMVPPRPVTTDPDALLDFLMDLRFPEDARSIYATSKIFPRSSWEDIAMRSSNLDRFHALGGKLIVPHGVSDPVFTINDTIRWRNEVDARYHHKADGFVRLFPVPGMAHCGGGPATDRFDAFSALTAWVEKHKAPEFIPATAGPQTPWPGRTRPLCAYPRVARYDGKGPINSGGSFRCQTPSGRA